MISDLDFLGVIHDGVDAEVGIGEDGQPVVAIKITRRIGPKSVEGRVVVISESARLRLIEALEAI